MVLRCFVLFFKTDRAINFYPASCVKPENNFKQFDMGGTTQLNDMMNCKNIYLTHP